ncbi:AraC family transcriptional regulator N-terminal domain-containing protein [Myxococcota bacterium]
MARRGIAIRCVQITCPKLLGCDDLGCSEAAQRHNTLSQTTPPGINTMGSANLLECVDRLATHQGLTHTEWPGLVAARISQPMARTPAVYFPSLCVVAQGRKIAYLGDQPFEYDPGHYLLCSLPLPIETEILAATQRKPMLAVALKFDPARIGKLMVEMEEFMAWSNDDGPHRAVAPCQMTDRVQGALVRFLEAVLCPMERQLLGSGLERELLFQVLRGPNGGLLRHFVLRDGSARRVARVVSYLEKNFLEPLDVKAIAEQAGMSASSLHEHFRRATSLSPIQFVKRLRLHEARAQVLGGRTASEAAYAVGYSSPSQFSREFRRMFGCAPSQISA